MTDVISFDNRQAEAEGWRISNVHGSMNGDRFRLERLDEAEAFPTDDAAAVFVSTMAAEGSDYHRSAIDFLTTHPPNEAAVVEQAYENHVERLGMKDPLAGIHATVHPSYEAAIRWFTRNLRAVSAPADRPAVQLGGEYVLVCPDLGDEEAYSELAQHRFQSVRVITDRQGNDDSYVVRAGDGWVGAARDAELFPLHPGPTMQLPENIAFSFDEDGLTEEGSIAVKRAFIDCFQESESIDDVVLSPQMANLVNMFGEEFTEVSEEFERNRSAAYR